MCQEKRLLRIDEVLEIVGVSKSVLYEMIGERSVSPARSHQSEGGEMAPTRYRRMAGLPTAGNRGGTGTDEVLEWTGTSAGRPWVRRSVLQAAGVRLVRRWILFGKKRDLVTPSPAELRPFSNGKASALKRL